MAFTDDVKTKYDNRKGSNAVMKKTDITTTINVTAAEDVIDDYLSEKSSNITTIGNKSTFKANLSTYGCERISESFIDMMFNANSCGSFKTYNADGTANGSIFVKDQTAYYVASHSNYDKILDSMAIKAAKGVADSKSKTTTASSLNTDYATSKSNW